MAYFIFTVKTKYPPKDWDRFILNTTGFLIGLFLLNLAFFGVIRAIYYHPYENVVPGFDTYLLSDSKGYHLRQIPDAHGIFNFSAPSESYPDMYRKIKYLIRRFNVKKILLSADEYHLSSYRQIHNNLDRSVYFSRLSDFEGLSAYFAVNLKRVFPLLNAKSAKLLREFASDKIASALRPQKRKPILWHRRSEQHRKTRAMARLAFQFPDNRRSESLTAALENIIRTCSEHGIELIGIKFPVARNYIEVSGPFTFDIEKYFRGKGLPVYDFEHLFENRDDLFLNQDHLNPQGAEEFVKILVQTIPGLAAARK